jgi:hypothetical protein
MKFEREENDETFFGSVLKIRFLFMHNHTIWRGISESLNRLEKETSNFI